MILATDTITVLRATTAEDRFGNETPSWGAAEPGTPIEGCSVQPLDGPEQTVGRDTVVSRWRVWAPPEADVMASDRVRFNGTVYDVDGEVQRWSGALGHTTFLLRKV